MVSQDGIDLSLVETHPSDDVKEIGENSKHKVNQRKRNEKRLILREWKLEEVKLIKLRRNLLLLLLINLVKERNRFPR